MSVVHFVHGGRSYLPELAAYTRHIQTLGHSVQLHANAQSVPDAAQAVWWMCGRVNAVQARRLQAAVQVHEYASASVAPLAWLKDRFKQWQQPQPDFRVFQSEWVRLRMGFDDAVPYALRDMGVPEHFLTAQASQPPEFDAVYLGEMSRLLHFLPLLEALDQAGVTVLLVGDVPVSLQAAVSGMARVQATGRVPQADVPHHLLRARCGLNLMPDVLPLNAQTSTKMLEYLAVGLPVISNPYDWAQRTAMVHAGRVHLLEVGAGAQAWQDALQRVPAQLTERGHLWGLTWSAQLPHLPVWQALWGDCA